MGSSARKTVQWTVFSENGPVGPGELSPEATEGLPSRQVSGKRNVRVPYPPLTRVLPHCGGEARETPSGTP